MNVKRDPDAILASWLEDGPNRLPDATRRAIAVHIRTTRQSRRPMWAPWRTPSMNPLARTAVLVVAIAIAVGGSIYALSPGPGGGGPPAATPTPTSSPTPAPSIAASATPIDTADWKPFSSTRYEYNIKYPPFLTATQSIRQWSMAVDRKDWLSPANDTFKGQVAVTIFSVDLPAGISRDAWIASFQGKDGKASPDPCGPLSTSIDLGTNEVDGHPVVFWRDPDTEACGGTYAYVVVGNRLYVFFIGLPGWEPTLEAMLSTVTFRP